MVRLLSVEQIIKVHTLSKQGVGFAELVKQTGVKNPPDVIRTLDRIDAGKLNKHKRNKNYFAAIKILTKTPDKPIDIIEKKENGTVSNEFDKLDIAFSQFTQSINSFIEYQIEKQIGMVKKENERLKNLVSDMDSELLELKQSAKNSNWINTLKSKWS